MECNECGMCCYIPKIFELDKPHYVWCEYYVDDKCEIYDDRPTECRLFECLYSQMEKCSENMRPDMCGVMFEKFSNTLIVGSILDDVTMLDRDVIKQIQVFMNEGISVVLQHIDIPNPYIFYTKDRTAEEVFKEFKEIRNGSA
jgi:Fe-S-cluster containining protein